ncbi:hypothetical protein, conserved [Leishmania donovani]|uniref:Uncharacterized protein n=1 Tax=Leishmania donovani TaxID=5661 RepID=E9B8K8_LEIDO|nr:hypothetical protein, conserved [Leishmania donovani]CBZ31581.1 hypothetical protein, conserved [Leishmania donovani]
MSNKKQTWANAHSQLWTSSVARSAGSRTQSEVSSIASTNRDRSLLDDADGYHQPPSNVCPQELRHQAYQPNDKTLAQVSDILESYGAIACDADIPAVLLEVVKELEREKRDNNFKDLLLREYSDTVQRRFGLYGEESPPSIAEVSARLRDGAPARPVAAPNPAWLEQPLNELWRTVCDGMQACFEKNADLSAPVLLPEARRTKANVSQLLHTSCGVLTQLAKEYTTAKAAVMKKMESTVAASQSFRQLTLSAALSELEAQQELKGSASEDGGASAMGGSHTVGSALQSLIDVVPASLQIHFNLQVPEAPVLTRCSNLTELIRFLLSEYLSMERYMEMVEAERQRLAEVFYLPSSKADANGDLQLGEALSRSLRSLQETVTSVVAFPHHISEEEMALRHSSAQAVEELAQLLVDARRGGSVSGSCTPHSVAAVRVEPPTRNLLEMVELVKSRFATVTAQQQRRELAGAQGRVGLAHMEESMTKHGKHVVQLLRDLCVAQEDAAADSEVSEQLLVEVMGNVDLERNLTPAKLDHFLSDVVERLRMVKTKYQRALNAAAAGKARAEAASQKSTGLQKRLQKVAAAVERIGRDGLGLTFPSTPAASGIGSAGEANDAGKGRDDAEDGRRGNGVSALRRLNLRPALEPSTATKTSSLTTTKDGTANEANTPGAAVTEHNVLEALQLVASRIGTSGEVRDWAVVQEELAQLRAGKARWKADTSAFHEAMAMLMQRLAKNGQMVKQTLFLMGTDESAEDELVEEVLQRGSEEELDSLSAEAMEYVERSLAELLQKYNRWAQRLLQTTEDHLYTQRKIVKYFAAVCRFFSSQSRAAAEAPAEDIPEDNLYDIDSCLMRAADIILPSLDAAIQAAAQEQCPAPATATPDASATLPPLAPSSEDAATSGATSRQETLVQLARDSTAAATGGVLPYDHRIARLYETVARLYTAVTSLLQVHYLCIPSASRRRSSGETELMFDGDANDDGFVDIDLDRLIRVSQQRSAAASAPPAAARRDGVERERFSKEGHGGHSAGKTPTPSPPSTIAANNDLILRVTYQNMEVLQDTLKRFSANHKMAAIVLQKDVDTMQQLLAGMLERYSEVDMDGAFGQSRETLHELYVTLRDRGQRQKGCYFFNRVGGEGSCTWVTALEHLAEGFRGVVDRLVQRTTLAAEYRRLVDEVVDVCAMYMNWAERRTLPASHALPPELLALCVRDGSEVTAKPTVATMVEGGQSSYPGGDVEASTKPASGGTTTINATTATVAAAAAQRPPKPSRTPPLTPRASNKEQQERQQQHQAGQERGAVVPTAATAAETKISHFTNDGAVLKVMAHMFHLAQLAVESPPATGNKTGDAAAFDADAKVQQLTEEMQLLREAVAIAEHHVDELTDAKHVVELQRDQAQSEAAVARAELRRWKRQQQQHEQKQCGRTPAVADGAQVHSPPRSPREAASTHQPGKTADGIGAVIDEATVKEVMEYMRVLSEELQMAKKRVSGSSARAHKLVRSPCQTASSLRTSGAVSKDYADVVREEDGEDGSAADGDEDAPYGAPHSHRHRRSYAELAEQLRHQYGSTAIAPMIVIDPKTHSYSNSQRRSGHTRDGSSEASHAQNRYSPVKYRGPEYDACDRYYARELAQVLIEEGKHAAHSWRRRSIDARHPATTKPAFSGLSFAPTSQRHLSGESSRGAAPPSARDLDVCHLGGSGNSAAAAPHRRYPPRSLSRDEPLLSPGAAAASASLASPHAYHAPQRAISVAAAAAPSYRLSPKSATPGACRHSSGNALFSTPMEACAHHHRGHYDSGDNRPRCADTEGEEVFYDADTPRAQTGWRWSTPSWAAPQPRRRPSAARERLCSPHEQSTKASILSQQRCPKVHDGRCEPPEDVGESLAAAVRQFDAVTQRTTATPTRRGSQAGSRQDTLHGSPVSVPPASTAAAPASEQQMSRNANLRAAALRSLAEVVSKTAVPTTRRARF